MKNNFEKLTLKNVEVLFKNDGDAEFKPSLVINADDQLVRSKIASWVERNGVGERGNAGKPQFAEYRPDKTSDEVHYRYSFRITEKTRFNGINGLGEDDIGRGAIVSLIASPYKYDKFGGGVGRSLNAVKVLSAAENSNDQDMDDLMGESDDEIGSDEEIESDNELDSSADEQISLEDIPF